MNARKVQIDFDEAGPVAPVTLRLKSSTGASSTDITEVSLGPNPSHTLPGAIREETARASLFLAAEKPLSRHAQPIRWGINE